MYQKLKICIFLLFLFLFNQTFALTEEDADVSLLITPIKYELELDPGESITKTVKIRNRSSKTVFLTTGKSDVTSEGHTNKPIFIENGNPNQELANWITIHGNNVTLNGLSDYDLTFDINVPHNAAPGGHYGAVYFNYDPEKNGHSSVGIDKAISVSANYSLLILVHVNGEIVENGNVGGTEIGGNNTGPGGINYGKDKNPVYKIDNCPLGDYSNSNYDGKCFDDITIDKVIEYINNNEETGLEQELTSAQEGNTNNENVLNEDNFEIEFNVPFQNTGNTHIKPSGEITFIDENGNQIKGIGTQDVYNERGEVIGQNVIDNILINPEDSNVLPDTTRDFTYIWSGFPYQALEDGKVVIKYMKPSDIYGNKFSKEKTIYPWQKIHTKIEWKKVTAITKLHYIKNDGEIVEYETKQDFFIEYKTQTLSYNIYFFILVGIGLFLLGLLRFFFVIFFRKKCKECKKRVKRKMKICPYCGADLKGDSKKSEENKTIKEENISTKPTINKVKTKVVKKELENKKENNTIPSKIAEEEKKKKNVVKTPVKKKVVKEDAEQDINKKESKPKAKTKTSTAKTTKKTTKNT